jgi:filamentous hemagglutinin family protein
MKRLIDYKSRFRILKGGKVSLVVSAMLGGATISFAAPSGGTVTSGTANIVQNGTTTNINQSTSKASINWQNFSIAQNETVNFNQPSSSSITLNRVIGNERSVINGALNANGQVWILNSNGVLFGKNASINTAGLLATTANLSDGDFQNGNYNFTDATANSVINEGTITISDSGSVIFASNEVRNSGTIQAVKGNIQLIGASDYTINLNGNSLVNLKVDKGVLDALVENSGTILADGGDIYLTTNAVDELLKGVVNNTGIIEANSIDGLTGHVELFAHGGTSSIDGTIEAQGGFVETSAKDLSVKSTAQIKTAHWLIDPDFITISSAGEDGIGGGSISATTVQAALADGSVTLQADEDITVNEDITWAEATKLTLSAGDEIFVNKVIENTNASNGGVFFNSFTDNTAYDGSRNQQKVTFAGDGKVIINNVYQLQWMDTAKAGKYELGSNIDASATTSWETRNYYDTLTGKGFVPVSDLTDRGSGAYLAFTGSLDGKGYSISNLYIEQSNSSSYIGLFGGLYTGAIVQNLNLIDVDIKGGSYVGAVVGTNMGTVSNVSVSGTITGKDGVGGIAGWNGGDTSNDDVIENSYSFANVSGYDSDSSNIGGIVGKNFAIVRNTFSNGTISTGDSIGGIAGFNAKTIEDSFSVGDVSGDDKVGGLIGESIILNTTFEGAIENSYSSGEVTGNTNIGGLIGENSGTATNTYWDSDSSNQASAIGNDTTAQTITEVRSSTATVNAFTQNTYTGFDFTNDWYIVEGDTRPVLRSMYSTDISNRYQLQLINLDRSSDYTLQNNIDLTNVETKQSDIWNVAKGWSPIESNYGGTFDGAGYTIDNLYINQSNGESGLFLNIIGTGVVKDLTFKNVKILSGDEDVSTLAYQNEGTIDNVHITGTSVLGSNTLDIDYIGALISRNFGTVKNSSSNANILFNTASSGAGGLVAYSSSNSKVENSYATGDVTSTSSSSNVGGLVGYVILADIEKSYATGDVSSEGSYIGGLVGKAQSSNVKKSYATGDVTTTANYAGGLVGLSKLSHIEQSYATGKVKGINYVGGLIGQADNVASQGPATVLDTYATGNVEGTNFVGGLVGDVRNDTVTNSYSNGLVTSSGENVGGLIGNIDDPSLVTNSVWDKETSGKSTSAAGISKTTSQMNSISTFKDMNWDIASNTNLDSKAPVFDTTLATIWMMNGSNSPSSTSSTQTKSTANDANDVITAIVNTNVIKTQLPKTVNNPTVVNNQQLNTPNPQTPQMKQANTNLASSFGVTGTNAQIVSTTSTGENANTVVTLADIKQAMSESSPTGTAQPQEVRVPLSKNSIVDLVNGGVNLPDGVDQQFFVVSDEI